MTDFVIISDLHLDIYDNRLEKYLELADVLVQKCKEESSKELIIAGDILNRSTCPPAVLYTLEEFIRRLTENGIKISYVLGQHDYDKKDISEDLSNTYLGMMNMEYVGQTHRNVEGIDVYFKDFERTDCVEPEQCDILIGHVSLGFQDIDQSRIRYIGICGDIHKPLRIGNCVSVSPPMQIHAAEPQQGYYVSLKIDNGEIAECKRKELPMIFSLPEPQRLKEVGSVSDLPSQVESYKIPENISKDIDLSGIPKPIDFNFRVTRLEIVNYKAIKHRELKLDENKVVFLQGANGASKTTTLDALYYAFVKSRQKFDKLEVDFVYQNSQWTITRGTECRVLKDGKEVPFKSKLDFEDLLLRLFPFIPLLNVFYIRTYHRFFECDRVKLFEELFNLKEYSYVALQAKNAVKTYEGSIASLNLDLARKQGELKVYEEFIEAHSDYAEIDREQVLKQYTWYKESKSKHDTLVGVKTATESAIRGLETKVSIQLESKEELLKDQENSLRRNNLTSQIARIRNQIIVCPTCGTRINSGNVDDLEKELEEIPAARFKDAYIRDQLAMIASRENDLKSLAEKKDYLEKVNTRLQELSERLEGIDIEGMHTKLNQYDELMGMKEKAEGLGPAIQQIEDTIKELESKIADATVLLASVDIKNPESIPVRRLEELVKYVETDEIKFSILSQLKNGNDKLDIQVVYHGIEYDELSSGEKCMMDLHLIHCITRSLGIVGIIILDESLAGLSEVNYELAGELIKEFSTYNVLVTSHQIGFNKFDRRIELKSGDDECL